jgi:hypothetical protein
VSGLYGNESRFEIETQHAVVGVRGTTFRVDAHPSGTVQVRVYAGAVAVTQRAEQNPWEWIVGRMMEMTVAADGAPGKSAPFTDEEQRDDFTVWNQELDRGSP